MPDAVVIGSGPNGLVAANLLADRGWEVIVFEAQPEPGGGVRSAELIEPGFINDLCSAFYPLAAASPVIQSLQLEKYGLRWLRAPLVLAHPSVDGKCPSISTDLDETANHFDQLAAGDGEAWRRLYQLWEEKSDDILAALFTPFPPLRAGLRLAKSLSYKDILRFARFTALPVRRLGEEQLTSEENRRLLAGLALHADFLPESSGSGFFGWFLACLGQQTGFPVPEGGAGKLTDALVTRLESRGGSVQCGTPITGIIVRSGVAVGVRTADGNEVDATRAVLADVDAPTLYGDLLPESALPANLAADIAKFQWDSGTFKVDWTLDGPTPWEAPDARRAGTVHIAESVDELSVTASQLAQGRIPERPFLLFGQQGVTDPTRAPSGKDTAWAYTHVPISVKGDSGGSLTGSWNQAEGDEFADRIEARIEELAPGFRSLIRGRHVATPLGLQAKNQNLLHGAVGGGTAQLHQQLVFRPIPGMGRAETPIQGLFLASSSAHPGGGVHGACGSNAARAAVSAWRTRHLRKGFRRFATRNTNTKAPLIP